MIHLAQRAHAFVYGLFRPGDEPVTRALYDKVARQFAAAGLQDGAGRIRLAEAVAEEVLASFDTVPVDVSEDEITDLVLRIFDYEAMFVLPSVDWSTTVVT
jgi:hypothetical protein